MGRVFFNQRLHLHKITADYQCLASDSGKLFLCNPTATTAITLPTFANAGEGWYCKIMITEDVAGTVGGMGQIVNVDFGSGNVVIGQIGSSSNVAGDFIDVFTDGTNWYVQGMATDSTAGTGDVLFHTAAAA